MTSTGSTGVPFVDTVGLQGRAGNINRKGKKQGGDLYSYHSPRACQPAFCPSLPQQLLKGHRAQQLCEGAWRGAWQSRACDLECPPQISLAKDLPVALTYYIGDLGHLKFYLAPKIDEDEDD